MELELELELVDRSTRPLRLTAAGAALQQEAQAILERTERALERSRRTARGERGRVAVASLPWAQSHTLPAIVRAFQDRAPRVRVELSTRRGGELADALVKEWVDVGFVRVPVITRELQAEPFLEEALVAIVPEDHRLAERDEVSLDDLADERFISIARERARGFASLAEQCEHGLRPAVVHQAPDPQAQLALVAAGVGIGLHLAPAATRHERGVVYIALKDATPIPPLAMLWRRDDKRELLHLFLDTAREVARSLKATPPSAAALH